MPIRSDTQTAMLPVLSRSQKSCQRQLLFPSCGLEVTVQLSVQCVLHGLAVELAEQAAFTLLVLKLDFKAEIISSYYNKCLMFV